MSEFINIEFVQGEGLFLKHLLQLEIVNFFDLSLLGHLTEKKLIDNWVVAEMMFFSIKTRIHRACTLAQEKNPNWPADIRLNLARANIF